MNPYPEQTPITLEIVAKDALALTALGPMCCQESGQLQTSLPYLCNTRYTHFSCSLRRWLAIMYLYVIHYLISEGAQHPMVRKNTSPSQVVGYIRVSTDEQSLSVEAQRATLTAWCQARQLTLVAVYEDVNSAGALCGRAVESPHCRMSGRAGPV